MNSKSVILDGVHFHNNSAGENGSDLYFGSSHEAVEIRRRSFYGTLVGLNGGGTAFDGYVTGLGLTASWFGSNGASARGGGLYLCAGNGRRSLCEGNITDLRHFKFDENRASQGVACQWRLTTLLT